MREYIEKFWGYTMAGHKNTERGKYARVTLSQVFGGGMEEEFEAVRIMFL